MPTACAAVRLAICPTDMAVEVSVGYMSVGWACGRARGRGALREGGWDGRRWWIEGSGMGGHGDWRGSGMRGSGILGRLGHAVDGRALIDLKSLYYFLPPSPTCQPIWSVLGLRTALLVELLHYRS
jgi:hypothetical protein